MANPAIYVAYKCGCNRWSEWRDGCCIGDKNKTKDDLTKCRLQNKVVATYHSGPLMPIVRQVISMNAKLTHDSTDRDTTDNKTFNVLPVVGAALLLLIVVVLAVRVYGCVNAHIRRGKNSIYRLRRNISLSLETLTESKV